MRKASLAIMICFFTTTLQAGGVSSSSLSSLNSPDNLSAFGLDEVENTAQLYSESVTYYSPGSKTKLAALAVTGGQFTGTYEGFFYQISKSSSTSKEVGNGSGGNFGGGWANDGLSAGINISSLTVGTDEYAVTQMGAAFRLNELFYLGVTSDAMSSDTQDNTTGMDVSVSMKADKMYLIEIISGSEVEQGVTTTKLVYVLEYQFENIVAGYEGRTDQKSSVSYAGSKLYVALQPEKEGLTAALKYEQLDSSAIDYTSITFQVGYDF